MTTDDTIITREETREMELNNSAYDMNTDRVIWAEDHPGEPYPQDVENEHRMNLLRERIQQNPELAQYADLLLDPADSERNLNYCTTEAHLVWATTAPIADLLAWAQAVTA